MCRGGDAFPRRYFGFPSSYSEAGCARAHPPGVAPEAPGELSALAEALKNDPFLLVRKRVGELALNPVIDGRGGVLDEPLEGLSERGPSSSFATSFFLRDQLVGRPRRPISYVPFVCERA